MAVTGELMAQLWELGIPEDPADRVHLAIAGGFINDPPPEFVVRVAPVIDPRQLWDLLAELDPPIDECSPGLRVWERNVRARVKQIEEDIEALRCMHERHTSFSAKDALVAAGAELTRELAWERDALARAERRVEELDRAEREREQTLKRGPPERRRKWLAPLAADLVREHEWSYADVAALVVRDDVWLEHPCPETFEYWAGPEGRSLADTLRQDVRRLTRA